MTLTMLVHKNAVDRGLNYLCAAGRRVYVHGWYGQGVYEQNLCLVLQSSICAVVRAGRDDGTMTNIRY